MQDSFRVRDKAQRRLSRLGKALASGRVLAAARLQCRILKVVANERVEEKDLGHNPVGNARAAASVQVVARVQAVASVQAVANVKVEESAPPEGNAKVAENVRPADRVKAGAVAVEAAARPPNRVPMAAVRLLRPDNPRP